MMDQYLETQVMTASPLQLHLLVVEGALKHARIAASELESGNREQAHFALNRSRDCVAELMSGIREEADSDLGNQLKQLFTFAFHRLAMADLEQSAEKVEEATRILERHRDTWLELMNQLGSDVAQQNRLPLPSDHASEIDGLNRRSWSA